MTLEALTKALKSSKVLLFLVFAIAITVAVNLGVVDAAWYQETLANAFYALMGGYSLVEVARAFRDGKLKEVLLASKLVEQKKEDS